MDEKARVFVGWHFYQRNTGESTAHNPEAYNYAILGRKEEWGISSHQTSWKSQKCRHEIAECSNKVMLGYIGFNNH